MRQMSRIGKALRNPLFVADIALEYLGGAISTAYFRIQCLLHGVRVGRHAGIFGRAIIRRGFDSRIELGHHVQVISSSWRASAANCTRAKLRTFYPSAAIIIGNHSGMSGGAIVARSKTIRIGNRCMLAPNVTIMDSDFHVPWPPERRFDTWETDIDEDVTLEDNVWVGVGAVILKGVTIGQNSIIGAGSVVTSDIPPNCIAG